MPGAILDLEDTASVKEKVSDFNGGRVLVSKQ